MDNTLFRSPLVVCRPADIRTVVDEFYEPSADGGDTQTQVTYECLSLLCGRAGGGECGGGVLGGGRFAEGEAFVEKLSFRLERDRAQQRRVSRIHSLQIHALNVATPLAFERLRLLETRENWSRGVGGLIDVFHNAVTLS